mgnify:FL=1
MYENKKIFILGFAKSGYEVAKVLANKNNYILINDGGSLKETDKEKYEELKNLGVNFVFNSHPDDLFDESYDLLIKNPGISIDHKYVLKANKLNIPVVNEVEVAYNLLKDKNVKIIAITGTNGKTTTTTLIYEMLKKDKFPVHLAGNIGYPLCSILDKVKENDIIVTEISCQQLENMHEFNPNVAVMTNISEAHLEFMKTFEHYKYVKSKLLKNQTNKDVAILNYSDEILKEFSKNVKSKVKWYSSKEKLNGSYILNDNIYYYDELIISLKDIKLRGIHNYENIMASIMAVKEFNCSNDSIKEVLENFYGVEHRLEFVKEVNNVKYYNDTEATNIKCTQIALSSFNEPTILILGGYERGQDFNLLLPFTNNVKTIIAIGETKDRVEDFAIKNNITCYKFETLKESFTKIKEIIKPGDIVLLSPASASWDQYNRCEERGDEFKKYVNTL